MKLIARGLLVFITLLLIWEMVAVLFHLPSYILPTPFEVIKTLYFQKNLLLHEAIPTVTETLCGLILGIIIGSFTAILMAFVRPVSYWLLPSLIISQAIPTFAIAPLLVIWFGYGMASKIVTTIIMLFFPITSAFYDGLKQTDSGFLDLAKTMQAKKSRIFWFIRIPAALPHLASGIRVATVIAPIGAIIGEWVGSSHGLGFLMLNANARMQIDLMFAALFVIMAFSLLLYFAVNQLLKFLIFWQVKESS